MAAIACGCISRGDMEVLETNLRQQQDLTSGYQRQLVEVREELRVARDEVEQLRTQLASAGNAPTQEVTEPLARVVGVQFNSMMTGGRDADGEPGPEFLTAVLSPHDADGDLVKLGGDLEIELLDLSRSGEEQRIGQWKYSAKESRELWHSGFLASGFQFDVPLKATPRTGQAVLHGRLTTSDGRQFDTSCRVSFASVAAANAPKYLAPPSNSKPLAGAAPRSKARLGGGGLHVTTGASKEWPEPADQTTVQPAGHATLDEEAESTDGEKPAKPVPNPPAGDVEWPAEAADEAEQPRPFPMKPADKSTSATTKRLPSGTRTSDNWTDETIPKLR